VTAAEQDMGPAEYHGHMVNRLRICIAAMHAFEYGGKSKNAGVVSALRTLLHEINDRLDVEHRSLELAEQRQEAHVAVALRVGAVTAYYPLITKVYDTLCDFRVIQPRDAVEPTIRDAVRELAQREKKEAQ
jgi:Arc/MetJ family transcription regulator